MSAIRYGLYFERDGTVLRIPVNPEGYTIQKEGDNAEYNVLGLGPVMVPRKPKLQVISWEGYFPGRAESGFVLTSGQFLPPKTYLDFVRKAMDDGAPVRFIANRYTDSGEPIFDTNLQVLVTSFQSEEKGGETGDFYYSLTLTEYRDYSPQTVQVQQDTPSAPATASAEPARDIPAGQLTVGAMVTVNGNYYYSSYGDEPHGTFSGFRGKVSRIVTNDPQRACPVHITTESGGARGWVKANQCQLAGTGQAVSG